MALDLCRLRSRRSPASKCSNARRPWPTSAPDGFLCRQAEGGLQVGNKRHWRREMLKFGSSQFLRKGSALNWVFSPSRTSSPVRTIEPEVARSRHKTPHECPPWPTSRGKFGGTQCHPVQQDCEPNRCRNAEYS